MGYLVVEINIKSTVNRSIWCRQSVFCVSVKYITITASFERDSAVLAQHTCHFNIPDEKKINVDMATCDKIYDVSIKANTLKQTFRQYSNVQHIIHSRFVMYSLSSIHRPTKVHRKRHHSNSVWERCSTLWTKIISTVDWMESKLVGWTSWNWTLLSALKVGQSFRNRRSLD